MWGRIVASKSLLASAGWRLLLLWRQLWQCAQGSFIPFGIEGAVFFEQGVDFDGQDVGHHLQDVFALVAHQGQLVERGLGGGRVVAFDLVLDRFNQGGLGELFFVVVDIGWLAHGRLLKERAPVYPHSLG